MVFRLQKIKLNINDIRSASALTALEVDLVSNRTLDEVERLDLPLVLNVEGET
jgi:hypothetical protein